MLLIHDRIKEDQLHEELYGRDKDRQLLPMKHYIKKGNNLKKYAAAKKSETDIKINVSNAGTKMFLITGKDNMPKHLQQLDNLSNKMQNLLECANSVIGDQIEKIVGSYHHIKKLKYAYKQTIKDEVAQGEISKLELFNESKLKIKLSKFSGYDSKLDVYIFQSEFIKIYKQATPTRMENNHLEGAALSLVQSVDNIDEIWQRLKSAYGHPKLLLKKKLLEINKISQLSKLKDTERVVAALSQIINTKKDSQRLASEHHRIKIIQWR